MNTVSREFESLMPPQAVLDALGGSIAAGELKGDYAAAETAAAAALEAARAGRDPNALADAAIWASIVSSLRFEPDAATERLDEALAALPGHTLGAACRHFAIGVDRRLPDGNLSMALTSRSPHTWTEPLSDDLLEVELYLLTALPWLGTTVQMAFASTELPPVQLVLEGAEQSLAPGWALWPHVRLAAATLCRAGGAPDQAQAHLDAAASAYAAAGDDAGVAGCDLARGAWATVPAGSPLTLGLALPESMMSSLSSPGAALDRTLASASDPVASGACYERAEEGFRAARAPRGIAMVDLHRAAAAALQDDPAAAREAAERAAAGFSAAGDPAGAQLASAHGALARIHAREWPERIDVAEAIGAWGRGPGSFGWALGIGMLFSQAGWRWLRRDGDADRAVACHRLAEATYTALGATDFAQQTHADRAEAYEVAGDLERALAAADRAVRELQELIELEPDGALPFLTSREGALATSVRALAWFAHDPKLLERLRPSLERQRASYEALAAGQGIAALITRGDPQQFAEAAAADTLALAQDAVMGPTYEAERARRKNPLAFRSLRERALQAAAALPEAERGRMEARVELAIGDLPAARKALADHPPPEAETSVADANLAVWLEDWPEARRRHQALEQENPDWWKQEPQPWVYLGYLAQTAEGLGELDRARALYEAAIALLEERRGQLAARDDRGTRGDSGAEAELYGCAARATLPTGATPEAAATALRLAERGRASVLLSRMAGSAALAGSMREETAELRNWRELTTRVEVLSSLAARGNAAAPAELGDAEAALRAAEAQLAAKNPRWLDAVTPPVAVLDADQIAAALPAGVVLIEYLLVSGALLAWAVTPDGRVQSERIPTDDAATDELQQNFWTACKGGSSKWEGFAEELGDVLLAPFDDAIDAAGHVILVPHRWGRLAPLHALSWRGAPLIETRTVSVLPSASALRFLGESAPLRDGPLLVVGDPTNMSRRRPGEASASGGFGALPWSGAQAAEAAAWFGAKQPLLGADAREIAVRERIAGARIVHFATHGLLDEAPLLSCIVLAEGDTLDVWELLGLSLDAKLVTLSACDSLGSPAAPGDELVGLAWLTLAAGAQAVVASLWKVSELSTALLMRAFYRALREGRPPREALAVAQGHVRGLTRATAEPEIAALVKAAEVAGRPEPGLPDQLPEDYAHPYHWAGFVLVGV